MRKKWKVIVLTLTLLVVGGAGAYTWWLYDSLNSLNKGDKTPVITKEYERENVSATAPAVPEPPEPPKWDGTERVNILLLGADVRGLKSNESPRTDTMMIASIDPKTKKATLMSILRDTYLTIPEYGNDRANAAYSYGGHKLAMQTLSNWTGLDIQYYIYTDFQGFIKLIDALGGIEFEVEKDMHYTSKADGKEYDINLKKGLQKLNGESALQYVRFRYDALSDFSRTKRQRELLTAVAQEMKSTWSIIQLPYLINQISPYVDTNLTVDDMIKLGALGLGVSMGENLQLPPSNLLQETRVHNADVLKVSDLDAMQAYIRDALEAKQAPASMADSAPTP
ncbi:LCP family protein [Paenibacillus marinisediminis]